ncbi:centrosomal protein of 19 kDa-like [Anneissia japonica]|uniref:centrosomal protein of 19 kDa-like n=1 Tax=Anneissia japonica TaxID=1529436 RepID=UPI0014254CEF|nr:centrosomal protein of 19 kDa-like [Anneissia japonica]
MDVAPKKCGVKLDPPMLVLTYENASKKLRVRSMPLRNFTKNSNIPRFATELKNNPRHKQYLEHVSKFQIEKLLKIVQEVLRGSSLNESLDITKKEYEIDPNEDLNKLDDEDLQRKKTAMNNSYEMNRRKPGDPDYQYDIEVEFPAMKNEGIETSAWDSGSDLSDF